MSVGNQIFVFWCELGKLLVIRLEKIVYSFRSGEGKIDIVFWEE